MDTATFSDVVVLGAGPAGCMCAIELARFGYSVTLVSKTDKQDKVGETCGPSVGRILEEEKICESFSQCGMPIEDFYSAWGTAEIEGRNIPFWEMGNYVVVHRGLLHNDLTSAMGALNIYVLRDCHLIASHQNTEGWNVTFKRKDELIRLKTKFIVEAAGKTARSILFPTIKRIYIDRLVCLSTEVCQSAKHQIKAIIETCPLGWWYSVPAPKGRRFLALFTDADLLKGRTSLVNEFWSSLNSTQYVWPLCQTDPETSAGIAVRDSRTSITGILWRGSWLPVGDSSWTADPLSGGGIKRALLDGKRSAIAIASYLSTGSSESLRTHAHYQWREFIETLITQRQYYQMEQRWHSHSFWKRRSDLQHL